MLSHKEFIQKADEILNARTAEEQVYLFYADITEFQLINETYGIENGDRLLEAAETLLGCVPEIAAFERIISDQFLFLVVTETAVTKEAVMAAYRYYSKQFLREQGANYPGCTLRIACGIYQINSETVIEAIDGSNAARKESKKKGSVNAVWYDHSVVERISEYHRKEQELRLALEKEQFCFCLQPKVNIRTGEIVGAEALARRVFEDGSIGFPDTFVDIMEANGSVVELDLLIFRKVCQFLSQRLRSGRPVVRTSVNLSRLHIREQDTADLLHSIAAEYRIPADLLEFELTETILLHEFSETKQLIDRLRNYGYHVSIDDFGSGYAGINIWQDLSFDVLKLDRRFLAEEEPLRSRNEAIVPNVINIAQRLGIAVVCEGVEAVEQCQYLLRLGCTIVQGFYFSKPVLPEEFYGTYESIRGYYKLTFRNNELPRDLDHYSIRTRKEGGEEEKKRKLFGLLLTVILVLSAMVMWIVIGIHAAASHDADAVYLLFFGAVILILLLFLACSTVLMYYYKWKSRLDASEKRYLLLGQFSDTVLFDYDYKQDIIRFTPNAPELLKIHGYEQPEFMSHLYDRFIYPGDYETVEKMLRGTWEDDKDEIRVRVLHPSGGYYFWCLVQFRYVYAGDELDSIIGKIIDIDEQKKREDRMEERLKQEGIQSEPLR